MIPKLRGNGTIRGIKSGAKYLLTLLSILCISKGGMVLNIEEIKTFLYVAEFKNFSRTAETLYCSQSTVTARIKALETELNCKLFLSIEDSNIQIKDAK